MKSAGHKNAQLLKFMIPFFKDVEQFFVPQVNWIYLCACLSIGVFIYN